MAHSAAGGVGFGAGGFSITADTDTSLKRPARCCGRWGFDKRHLLSRTLYYITYITCTGPNSVQGCHRRRSLRRLRICIANQYTYYLPPLTNPHLSISPFSVMTFLESVQDGLDRILPKRRKHATVSKSISGGIGNTAGIVRYQDDVRFPPAASFRSVLFLLLPRCSLVGRRNILISTSFPTLVT